VAGVAVPGVALEAGPPRAPDAEAMLDELARVNG